MRPLAVPLGNFQFSDCLDSKFRLTLSSCDCIGSCCELMCGRENFSWMTRVVMTPIRPIAARIKWPLLIVAVGQNFSKGVQKKSEPFYKSECLTAAAHGVCLIRRHSTIVTALRYYRTIDSNKSSCILYSSLSLSLVVHLSCMDLFSSHYRPISAVANRCRVIR